ncbi:MAG: hypothetical protein FWB96_07210 [Defluviitaleaceae bacterium]|nr:hypothetical protein [Defluviitaleaceae bacterium]MCL2262467.1 hypothetical protein [Defluviitaleaceae bacterium]
MYAEISHDGVTVDGEFYAMDELPRLKVKELVLAANVRRTVIRVAEIGASELSQDGQWALIEQCFPLGDMMNAETYVFDGSIFENENGARRFFMTALPVDISDMMAKVGVEMTGSIHRVARLDTVEHILFRQYVNEASEPVLIFLPQEDGIRILHIADNLPVGTNYISNDPLHREDQFSRFYNSLQAPPTKTIFPREGDFEWLRLRPWGFAPNPTSL